MLGLALRLDMDGDHSPSISAFSAASMRSQIACASATVMAPGTTRWNSRKVSLPAWRVRKSCASIAPSRLSADQRRGCARRSRRPGPRPSARRRLRDHRCARPQHMDRRRAAAISGSSQQLAGQHARPRRRPGSRRARSRRPPAGACRRPPVPASGAPGRWRSSSAPQAALMTVASALSADARARHVERLRVSASSSRRAAGSAAPRRRSARPRHGGEELRLVMPVRVVGVGRLAPRRAAPRARPPTRPR